jgi:hypothetical protein
MTLVRPVTPAGAPPPLPRGAARRIASIASVWVDETHIEMNGYARDLRNHVVTDEARIEAAITAASGADRTLTAFSVQPRRGDPHALLGTHVGSGFRARAVRAFPREGGTPLGLLLDDLPVACLVAGYAMVTRRIADGVDPATIVGPEGADARRDLCSGWRADGQMIASIEAGHGIPYHPLPRSVPPWDDPPLPEHGMFRRRRIDVVPGDPIVVDGWFRDSHVEADLSEGAIHEYSLHATVDPEQFAVCTIAATPHVLPYPECPAAAAAVGDVIGVPCAELRSRVRDLLVGTGSCTHLNDALRALADVPHLASS